MHKPAYTRNEFSQCTWNFCVGAGDLDKKSNNIQSFSSYTAENNLRAWGYSGGNEDEAGRRVHPRYETGTREFNEYIKKPLWVHARIGWLAKIKRQRNRSVC